MDMIDVVNNITTATDRIVSLGHSRDCAFHRVSEIVENDDLTVHTGGLPAGFVRPVHSLVDEAAALDCQDHDCPWQR